MNMLEDMKQHLLSPHKPQLCEVVTVIAAENTEGAGLPQLVTGFGSGWILKRGEGGDVLRLAADSTAEVHLSWDDGGLIRHQSVGLWAIRPFEAARQPESTVASGILDLTLRAFRPARVDGGYAGWPAHLQHSDVCD